MRNRKEKLSLLSEMIAFAKSDDSIKTVEYNFLLAVAKQLEISRVDFDYLINNPISRINLKSHSQRIVQFHRMVLLMHVDKARTQNELAKLYNYGLRMGLNHNSITKVLYLMEGFPDMMVPADVLIDIFKVQYN
ncbi:TerB family tellurite resistance protein [Olleya sp. YSTF-M6]|uniref:TerB family tellurite resistance protein n=1 Tax=Olleya sediminilitoris TaxID=2795739 RepID=A0ABS1WKH0_9FLAO|nr:TerB family tellurite resistance protein [Olleya sediminilitoris]MBL7559617.1 TerB family tellurite resistance protein [Olleya sediminilitoris]